MRYIHTKCGGEIDVDKRQCKRCKKKWLPILFWFDPISIRPKKIDKVKKHEIVFESPIIQALPKWPRWARIVVSTIVITGIIVILYLLRGR